MQQVLVGLESPSAAGLHGIELKADRKLKQHDTFLEAVSRIQSHGISVNGCCVLGLVSNREAHFVQSNRRYPGAYRNCRLRTGRRMGQGVRPRPHTACCIGICYAYCLGRRSSVARDFSYGILNSLCRMYGGSVQQPYVGIGLFDQHRDFCAPENNGLCALGCQ